MYVPVGSTFGGTEQFIQVTFAQNNTHLFMTLVWGDPGIDGSDMEKYGDADGVSIMWNVNASNFNMYYSGMKTEKPTEMVDTWTWKATVADEDNAFNSTFEGAVYDNAFDDGGWLVRPLSGFSARDLGRQDSPVPLTAFARGQSRETGTARRGAIRSCPESSQVVQARFEPGRIAVTQRLHGCYCVPARHSSPWRIERFYRLRNAERRAKKGVCDGERSGSRQESTAPSETPAMLK
jgi:hypothetical protein